MNNSANQSDEFKEELGDWSVEFPNSKEKSWDSIQAKLKMTTETPVIKLSKRFMWKKMAVAASICFALGLTFLLTRSDVVSFQTASAQTQEVVLPDNSIVILNSGSTLSYNAEDWSENREVKLTGEAFFEVEKGSAFKVVSPQGSVQVLGTGFNVFDRDDHFVVGCTHGKVKVVSNSSEVILTKGLNTQLNNNALVPAKNTIAIGSWRQGTYHYKKTPLVDVFDELERKFDVEIQWTSMEKRTYSGVVKMVDLDKALQIICEPMSLEYQILNNKQIIIE